MELTPTLILNLALLIVPPVALVLVFRKWLTRHIRCTVALTVLCDVLLVNQEGSVFLPLAETAQFQVMADKLRANKEEK